MGQQDSKSERKEVAIAEIGMNPPEVAGDEYQTPHPESITSICYSCTEYENCNVKTGTCTSCDQYNNRAEAYKTDEQRYSEEQDAIDRETKRKLREMQEGEKMENLPSDASEKKKYIRMAKSEFERIASGVQQYIITKKDGYKIGQEITVGEFADGRATGRTLEMEISHMDDDNTSSALVDGYCILNLRMCTDMEQECDRDE